MNSGSVKKSVIIDVDLEKVWSKISKISKLEFYIDKNKYDIGKKDLVVSLDDL